MEIPKEMINQNRIIYGQNAIVDLPTTSNRKTIDYYNKWHRMFQSCYDDPVYIGCSVSEEWHTLSTFKDWYYSQSNYGKPDMILDKNILVRGNKIYGSQYCRLVPRRLCRLLIYSAGYTFTYRKEKVKFAALCNNKTTQYLGSFDTAEEAFIAYKTYKEKLIKSIAEEYYEQNLIDLDIRNALLNWTINESD